MKAAIYVRVSTHHQIDKDSLPLQKSDLINYAKYVLGINNYIIFEDAGYSGKNTDRPGFQDMMSRIRKKEFTHLLVWKIDRISRNLLNFCDMYEEIKKYNCIFVSKNEQFDTSSAMGEAMLKIILVFAELERKLTGERVTSVMLSRAQKGLWNGAPMPIGYTWCEETKFPMVDENEKLTVEFIYNKYLETESTSVVRNALNSAGIKTKKNGVWTTKTLADIIRNPFYKGTYRYNYRESARGSKKDKKEWILVDDNHEAIISKELWTKCNEIMDVNAERNNAKFRSNSKIHVFALLVECGECHKSLYAKQDKPNVDGFIPSIYVCSGRYNHAGCNQKTISDKAIGTFVLNYISNILKLAKPFKNKNLNLNDLESLLLKGNTFKSVVGITEKSLEDLYNAFNYSCKNILLPKLEDPTTLESNTFELENFRKEKEKFKKAINKLEDLYLFDDEMSEKDYVIKKKKINDKILELDKKINDITSKNPEVSIYELNFLAEVNNIILSKELLKNDSINYKNLINKIGRETLKDFINIIIKNIIVKDKKILSITFKNGLESVFVYND